MLATIVMTGDVMLGRMVNKVLPLDKFSYVWGDTMKLLKRADFRIINLECVISNRGKRWFPEKKIFHFHAHPHAIEVLKKPGIDCVTLANNHTMDYGEDALLDMIQRLKENKILFTGAGENLEEASLPSILKKKNLRVGVVAITDNIPEWEAGKSKPGVFYYST